MSFLVDEQKQKKLLRLKEMGFNFVEAENCLISSNFNMDVAISMLSSSSKSKEEVTVDPTKSTTGTTIIGIPVEEGRPLLEGSSSNYSSKLIPPPPPPPLNDWWSVRHGTYEADRRDENQRWRLENGDGQIGPPPSYDPRFALNTRLYLTILFVVSLIISICGGVWAYWVFTNYPFCGTDLDSAYFSIYPSTVYSADDDDYDFSSSSGTRILDTNSCPGYDWTSQSTPAVAGDCSITSVLPLVSVNCTEPQEVGLSDPVYGHIGTFVSIKQNKKKKKKKR